MRLWHISLTLAFCVALAGCSVLKQDHTEGWSASQLYNAAKEEKASSSYSSAADYYTKLLSRFPYGTLAQQSLLDLAYVQYKSGEADKANASLDEFIKTYPRHPYIDYALYMKGVVEYERNVSFFDRIIPTNISQTDPQLLKNAFDNFKKVVDNYPNSEYAEDAKYRMVYIRNLLGEHYLSVATYYLRHGSYISAANRAKQVIDQYQQTPSAPYALATMIRAYKELGETQLADDAMRVFNLNYANMLTDPEIAQTLNGNIRNQPTLLERIRAKPKT